MIFCFLSSSACRSTLSIFSIFSLVIPDVSDVKYLLSTANTCNTFSRDNGLSTYGKDHPSMSAMTFI